MNLQAVYARHLVELGYLEAIVQDMGYAANLIEASDTVAYHTLLVQLEPDWNQRSRELACTFYPLAEEEAPSILLLQYFLEMPFEIAAGAEQKVNALLMEINNKTVLGHFGVTAATRKVHHRYIQTFAESHLLNEEAIADVVTLFNYTSLMFGEAIEAAATN
jgi:hypothetical protein